MNDWVRGDDLKGMVPIIEHAAEHGMDSVENRDSKTKRRPVGNDMIFLGGRMYEYCIKPKPVEFWGNFYLCTHNFPYLHKSEADARKHASHDATRIAVHFREVTDDD